MRGAGAWALEQNFTDTDISEAKISLFKGIDAPESVAMEGMLEFETGLDPATQQARRERLLDVTQEDVKKVAEKYLVEGMEKARVVVIGPRPPSQTELGWTMVKGLDF
jgi:Zn-dependent M16 (insulinase) family peptidase